MPLFPRRLLFLLLFLGATPCAAHPMLESGVRGTWGPEGLDLTIETSLEQALYLACGQEDPNECRQDWATAKMAVERQAEFLREGLRFEGGGTRLPLEVELVQAPTETEWRALGVRSRAFYRARVTLPPDGTGGWTLRHEILKGREQDGVPLGVWFLLSIRDRRTGHLYEGAAGIGAPFTADPQAPWKSAAGMGRVFAGEGVRHILRGWDHLLFVSALVLAMATFWDLFQVVGLFTLAHTLTLTLSALGWVRLSPSWVEPGIALSILVAAALNLPRAPASRAGGIRRARWAVAFGFGMIHGLGFAGGLTQVLGRTSSLGLGWAIGGFSLGVESGHLLVVAPLFLLLAWGRGRFGKPFEAAALRVGSWAIAGLGGIALARALARAWGA